MPDLYTKAVLTVIAACLAVLAAERLVGPAAVLSPARAQRGGCGHKLDPCYVTNEPGSALWVLPP